MASKGSGRLTAYVTVIALPWLYESLSVETEAVMSGSSTTEKMSLIARMVPTGVIHI